MDDNANRDLVKDKLLEQIVFLDEVRRENLHLQLTIDPDNYPLCSFQLIAEIPEQNTKRIISGDAWYRDYYFELVQVRENDFTSHLPLAEMREEFEFINRYMVNASNFGMLQLKISQIQEKNILSYIERLNSTQSQIEWSKSEDEADEEEYLMTGKHGDESFEFTVPYDDQEKTGLKAEFGDYLRYECENISTIRVLGLFPRRLKVTDVIIKNTCGFKDHSFETVVAFIDVKTPAGDLEQIRTKIYYCNTCHVYWIGDDDLKRIQKDGTQVCRLFKSRKDYDDSLRHESSDYLRNVSMLKAYGYCVSEVIGYTTEQRRRILTNIIDKGFMKPGRIVNYLKWFCDYHDGKRYMEKAVRKWNSDRIFVENTYLRGKRRVKVGTIYG